MPRPALALLLLAGLGAGGSPALAPAPATCAAALAALELGLAGSGRAPAEHHAPAHPPAPTTTHPPALLFHLHVPRTAGRTFHACLLTPGVPVRDRCARAYGPGGGEAALDDKDATSTSCRLLASHDDAGLTAGRGDLAILVNVRDPVARILSAYEFATEGAALRLNGSADGEVVEQKQPRRERRKRRGRPSTPPTPVEQVWPWSTLIPWLVEDMAGRGGRPMPLAAFVEAPAVFETLHEGTALQTVGATSAGSAPAMAGLAADVRKACVGVPLASQPLAGAAVACLEAALHVGTAEDVDASVAAAAGALGWDLHAPPPGGRSGRTLGEVFRECEDRTARRSAGRRAAAAAALGGVGPLEGQFGGRAGVPRHVIARIRALNAADMAVHAAAQALLADRLAALDAGGPVARLPPRLRAEEQTRRVEEEQEVETSHSEL